MTDRITLSQPEYERFGVRTARVEDIGATSLEAVFQFCADQSIALLIARCSASNMACVHQLQAEGFLLMDTACDYARELDEVEKPSLPEGVTLREATPADEFAVTALYQRSFANYVAGHYHADPRLDPQQATEAYLDWVKNSLRRPDEYVLVLESKDGHLIGASSCRYQGEEATLLLGATDPTFQNQGLHRLLFQASLYHLTSKGVRRAKTATQASNVAAQRVFYACGLKPISARYTFHKWFD